MLNQRLKKIIKAYKVILLFLIKSRFRPVPLATHLFLTRKCNLNCKYCCVRDPSKKELDEKGMKQVIDKLYSLGSRYICFYGGEPTLRKDLVALVEYANKKNMLTVVATNSTLLTPLYIDKLGQAELDVLTTSIDSISGFKHSKKHYNHSKKMLTTLIEARRKYGTIINVNLVLTNKNLEKAIRTIKLIHTLKIPISVGLINRNTYSDKLMGEELFFNTITEKKRLYGVLDEIIELKKQKYAILGPIQYYENIKQFLNEGLNWYCCAGEYYFSVDCDGKFQICAALPSEDINIFDVDKNYFTKFKHIREKRLKECKKLCFSDALYAISYTIKNPFHALKEIHDSIKINLKY